MMLTLTRKSMCFCMFRGLISKSFLVASCLSCSTYSSISSQNWFLCLALVREPTIVHFLPQLLPILDHQHVLSLFSLSLHLSFVFIPSSPPFPVLSSSTPIIPSVVVLLAAISVLVPATHVYFSIFLCYAICVLCFLLLLLPNIPA